MGNTIYFMDFYKDFLFNLVKTYKDVVHIKPNWL